MQLFKHKPTTDEAQITAYLNRFFDGNRLKKEDLRLFIKDQLTNYLTQLHDLMFLKQNQQFWQQLTDHCAIDNNHLCVAANKQIQTLPGQLDTWLRESVESPERFEFFVLSKAAQLNSGDQQRDYFNALMIRNDQLLAVNHTFGQAINHLDNCLHIPPEAVSQSDDLGYFAKRTIEDRIYKIAELTYKTRQKLGIL